MKRIAVIGGGPAGATAAAELAAAGVDTWLFHVDPAHGEKPCGGGVTWKAFRDCAALGDLKIVGNPIRRVTIVAPSGREVAVESAEPFFTTYGRGEFDAALRARAAAAGARIVAAKAEPVAADGGVSVRVGGAEERFDFVIGADGAFSAVRRAFAGDPDKSQQCPAVDELVEGIDPAAGAHLAFFSGVTGYLWVFPRRGLASAGMVAREGELPAAAMRERVRDFVGKRFPGARTVRSVGWVIPAPSRGIATSQLSSACHALVGDAAGLADPLTGEGIYYAIVSGALAARAIARGEPERYAADLEAAIGEELRIAARLVGRYFRPRVLDAILFLASRHGGTRAILADVLSGRQAYSTLGGRLTGPLGAIGWLLKRL